MLRLITDAKLTSEEAVRAYHGVLQAKNVKTKLPLEKDLKLTDQAMNYDGAAASRSVSRPTPAPASRPAEGRNAMSDVPHPASSIQHPASTAWPLLPNGAPNFEKMDSAQRRAYHLHRLTRKFG